MAIGQVVSASSIILNSRLCVLIYDASMKGTTELDKRLINHGTQNWRIAHEIENLSQYVCTGKYFNKFPLKIQRTWTEDICIVSFSSELNLVILFILHVIVSPDSTNFVNSCNIVKNSIIIYHYTDYHVKHNRCIHFQVIHP